MKNPDNPRQRRLFYAMPHDPDARHPQVIMRECAEAHNFTILAAVPQSAYDGWDFWIDIQPTAILPRAFGDNAPWKPIGEA